MLEPAVDALSKDINLNLAGDPAAEQRAIKNNEQTTRLINQTENVATTQKEKLSTGLSIFFSSVANTGLSIATWSVAKKYVPKLIAANQFLKGNLGSVSMAISGALLNVGCDRFVAGLANTKTTPMTWQEAAATLAAVGLVGGTASLIPLSGFAYVLTMGLIEPVAVRYTTGFIKGVAKECSQRLFSKCKPVDGQQQTPYQAIPQQKVSI